MNDNVAKKYPNWVICYSKNTFDLASPWKNANTSFSWLNFEYPLYHSHTDWEILIILNDRLVHFINGKEINAPSGTACLIGPKDQHALFYPDGKKNQFQGMSIMARDSYVKSVLNLFSPDLYDRLMNDPNPLTFSLSPSFLEDLTTICLEIQGVENNVSSQAKEQCNILFHSVLTKFLKQNQSATPTPNELAGFIRSLNNPQLSAEDIKALQQKLPYSYSNLTRLFKKYTNCTITQYVNNVKLQYAKELLVTTNMTTLTITNELQFDSISHFNHLFKKKFNMTPSQYRKQNSPLVKPTKKDE